MKKLLILAAAVFASVVALPTTAEARNFHVQTTIVYTGGYHSCGTPIRAHRVCTGFDRYNRPIYRYDVIPVRSYGHHRHHGHHHRHHGYHHRGHHGHHHGGYHRGHHHGHHGHHGSRHSHHSIHFGVR